MDIIILRRDIDILANKTMEAFFVPKGDKVPGKPKATLTTVTNKHLCRSPARELKLDTKNDLDRLRSAAEEDL